MVHPRGRGCSAVRRRYRRRGRADLVGRHRPGGRARVRPPGRRTRDPATHLPRAGERAEVARRRAARSSRRALPAIGAYRRDASTTRVRRRRRHSACCSPMAARARRELPNDTVYVDGASRTAGQGRPVRRPARLYLADRRRGPDQRVQLPGVGAVGEVRAGVPRRHAVARETSQSHRICDRTVGRIDVGHRPAAGRRAAARLRRRARPSRSPDRAGHGVVHRFGVHGPPAARPSESWSPGRCRSPPRPTR